MLGTTNIKKTIFDVNTFLPLIKLQQILCTCWLIKEESITMYGTRNVKTPVINYQYPSLNSKPLQL